MPTNHSTKGRNRARPLAGANPCSGENVAVDAQFVRICAVPALPPGVVDDLSVACKPGSVSARVPADPDLNCTLVELRAIGDVEQALRSAAGALKASARERLMSFEVQGAQSADPAAERALSASLAELIDAPVYHARREVPASAWVEERPISFGVDGFAIRAPSPTVARAQSRCPGVSLEFGAPTLLMKVGFRGVPPSALRRMCDAIGSPRGGLLHLGAYPAISVATGVPVIVLECSDPAKSPPARAIDLLDVEAARYGGAVAQTVLLSHIPLSALLGTLAARMQLPVEPAQIIETHVTVA
jgi:hypothetical protein